MWVLVETFSHVISEDLIVTSRSFSASPVTAAFAKKKKKKKSLGPGMVHMPLIPALRQSHADL